MILRYIVLDDNATSIGGTELTISSIIEDRINEIIKIQCSALTKDQILSYKDHIWIIGNITGLLNRKDNIYEFLFNTIANAVKLEFDYNFCLYRGEIPHQKVEGNRCECPYGQTGYQPLAQIYDIIIKNFKHMFFMSERQRAIYANHLPQLDFSKTSILSSCFAKNNLQLFDQLKSQPKNNKYAIISGFGGWHSKLKGVEEAKNFCDINNIPYDVLPTQPYEDHIKLLAQYKGLVFLPIIDDTCPRITIEARLLGLDVITNVNAQHTTEWWWKDKSKTLSYISSRPSVFWETIDQL